MIKSLYIAILIQLFTLHLNAQQKEEFSRRPLPNPKIPNLTVGDNVPEIIIAKIIRNIKPSAKMTDFKDQLLIIDFFDTFCGSCIEALPKLDSLQKYFGNRIKVLPVSYQSKAVMETFFNSNKFVLNRNVKLPCVVEDKVLGSYFQYKLVSHDVWIYKGKIVALTGTDYVTNENIQTILDGKKVNWPIKNDMVSFDPKSPIFVLNEADQYNNTNSFLKHSGVTGHREGIDYKKGLLCDTLESGYRSYIYNRPIVGVFGMITNQIKRRDFIPHKDRLILEVADKSKYIYTKGKTFYSDWRRENEICYELFTKKQMPDKERFFYIFKDLQQLLDVSVKWEKRPVKCLVISKTKDVNIDSLNTTRNGQKITISAIPVFYFDQTEKYPPAIDETGIKGNIVIEETFKNLGDFQKQLRIYGLEISEAVRDIEVMVIRENNFH